MDNINCPANSSSLPTYWNFTIRGLLSQLSVTSISHVPALRQECIQQGDHATASSTPALANDSHRSPPAFRSTNNKKNVFKFLGPFGTAQIELLLVKFDFQKLSSKTTDNDQEPKASAQWTTSRSLAFIDCLQEKAHLGHQSDNGFKPIACTETIDRWKLQYPPGFNIHQLKNHWTVITSHFKAICEIRKGLGVGWNKEEQRVITDDDFWANWHVGHKGSCQYKKKAFHCTTLSTTSSVILHPLDPTVQGPIPPTQEVPRIHSPKWRMILMVKMPRMLTNQCQEVGTVKTRLYLRAGPRCTGFARV
ncbi:hypothetical protein DFH28DRAFT_939787 [Melampsora americana]|nr:hypothetical protein DFH28DRAFT_939787 [Melampsora americana]